MRCDVPICEKKMNVYVLFGLTVRLEFTIDRNDSMQQPGRNTFARTHSYACQITHNIHTKRNVFTVVDAHSEQKKKMSEQQERREWEKKQQTHCSDRSAMQKNMNDVKIIVVHNLYRRHHKSTNQTNEPKPKPKDNSAVFFFILAKVWLSIFFRQFYVRLSCRFLRKYVWLPLKLALDHNLMQKIQHKTPWYNGF